MVSTPVYSFDSPAYLNGFGYINTPVISSASCTPNPLSTTHLEVAPTLDLSNPNMPGCDFSETISCNVNSNPGHSECKNELGTFESVSETSRNILINPQKTSTNSISSQPIEKIEKAKQEENLWQGNLNYEEYQHGGSNLFITRSGEKFELLEKLHDFNFEVRDIHSTSDKGIWNVIFETHPTARKAFTMQNRLRLRMVPPKNSNRVWLRNPSPKFLVEYETKCQLVVKSGKAEYHDVVGELLKGCLITADQLKEHHIRVVSCKGSFMLPGGKTVEMKGVRNELNKNASMGWISYRSKHTKESLVIRRSWIDIGDYIYNEE